MKYIGIIILSVMSLISLDTTACDCKEIKTLDSLREISFRHADLVFMGERAILDSSSGKYAFIVTEIYKGSVNGDTLIGKPFDSCSSYPNESGRWIVYANLKENGLIDFSTCGASRSESKPLCFNCPTRIPPMPPPGSSKENEIDYMKKVEILKAEALVDWQDEIEILKMKRKTEPNKR